MEIRVFTLRFDAGKGGFDTAELDAFCANKKIVDQKSAFFEVNNRPFWTIYIAADHLLPDEMPRIKEKLPELNEAEKALMDKLKAWRKALADAKGSPAFIVAKDIHLARAVTHRTVTLEALRRDARWGQKKVDTYGKEVIEIIKTFFGHEPAKS